MRLWWTCWIGILLALTSAEAQTASRGVASWYGEDHRGLPMANGKPFDPSALTCATWDFPFGTVLRVTRLHRIYEVKKGDTLIKIARSKGITTESLRQLNPGLQPNHLSVGQRINVGAFSPGTHVDVVVTDRGPARRLRRSVDLSAAAFARLASPSEGLIAVKVEVKRY